MGTYLIVVDVQKDFLPGGALAVPDGDAVIEPIGRLVDHFGQRTIFTRDLHPAGHSSFASSHGAEPFTQLPSGDMVWPDHCVDGTPGCELADGLVGDVATTVAKGTQKHADSYSGFYVAKYERTPLKALLEIAKADHVIVCGLATDYCVKATALDARKLGFGVSVAIDACRGVDAKTGDVERAYIEMAEKGVEFVSTDSIVNPTGRVERS